MTITPSLRINARFPFPSLVVGSSPITVGKLNGFWTIGLNVTGLSIAVPPVGNWPTDYVLVWDSVAKTFLQVSLQTFAGLIATNYRYAAVTPIAPAASDGTIGVDTAAIAGPSTVNLPPAGSRLNIPLTIKDRTKKASAFPITINANGADAGGIDGSTPLTINTDGQAVTLLPVNDAAGNGWVRTG